MITQASIDNLFDTIGSAITLTFVAANQKLERPTRVYATYQPVLETVEDIYQNQIEVALDGDDDASVSRWEASRTTVAINIFGDKNSDVDTLRTKAKAIINWVRENAPTAMVVRVLSPAVQDLTEWDGQNYHPRLQFDLRLDACVENAQTIEAMKTIEVTPTLEGVPRPEDKLVVNRP